MLVHQTKYCPPSNIIINILNSSLIKIIAEGIELKSLKIRYVLGIKFRPTSKVVTDKILSKLAKIKRNS